MLGSDPTVDEPEPQRVTLGRIVGTYGVRGWVKVYSYTHPPENIFEYSPWQLGIEGKWTTVGVSDGRRQGKGLIVRLEGVEDREQASRLMGMEVAVPRSQMPDPEPGAYYWFDLIGLRAINRDQVELGRVQDLIETGSNDVLVVKGEREHLIPYLPGDVVLEVDLKVGVIRVDWEPDL